MAWKEIRNGESTSLNTTNAGKCQHCGKPAQVISFFSATLECETDLQKTFRFKGYKCSLQEENAFQNPACIDECPLIQKKHL